MTARFEEIKLGALVDLSKGVSYKGDYLDRAGPLLLGLGVVQPGGGYREGRARTYGGRIKPHHSVRPGDLFLALTDITQDGSILGSPVIVPHDLGPAVLSHHVAALRLKDGAPVHLRYLYYALCTESSRSHFRGMATGTTVRAVSTSDAAAVAIPVPSMAEQVQIATVLGSIDDKIEVNNRTSRALEALAQTFFQARFMDFEGEDPSTMHASDIGPIPRGWEVGTLDSLIHFDPRLPLRKGVEATYVDMKALPTSGPSVSVWSRRLYAGGTRFQQGDTLLARITPCLENGKSALVDFLGDGEIAQGSTEFIVLRPKPGVPRTWPYCLVRHEPFRMHAIANMTGSDGRQRVAALALVNYKVAKPPLAVLRAFGDVTEPLFQRITNNTRESSVLRSLRNMLLPLLISGTLCTTQVNSLVEELV